MAQHSIAFFIALDLALALAVCTVDKFIAYLPPPPLDARTRARLHHFAPAITLLPTNATHIVCLLTKQKYLNLLFTFRY